MCIHHQISRFLISWIELEAYEKDLTFIKRKHKYKETLVSWVRQEAFKKYVILIRTKLKRILIKVKWLSAPQSHLRSSP